MDHILENEKFQKILEEISESTGQSKDQINGEAKEYLKELYTEQKPLVNAILLQISQFVLQRAYEDHIDVNPSEIKALSKLMRKHPVAFVMTHKTYIDMMVLGAVLIKHGLELPYTFAGINMSFLGLGELGRRSGVIFIRRSFKDNKVYKATLKHFVSHLVDEKAHFMWAIEGTRSRTGKLVWPQMGILKYIAEGEAHSSNEVKYVPVSVVYDLIPDVQDMTAEGRGKSKNPESLMWFLNYLKNLSGNMGKISLRIGEPVERTEDQIASIPLEEDTLLNKRSYSLPKFAFELVHRINHITPVTTSSLVCTILLSKFAASKLEIERDVIALMELIENTQPDALVDRGLPTGECVQNALNLLLQGELIQQLGKGVKAKYSIVTRNYLPATYYSNMAVHQLYHRAFIEMAILKVAHVKKDRLNAFWIAIMELRDLFKFEFFYSNKSKFSDEIELNLRYIDPNWEKKIDDPKVDLIRILKKQPLYVARVVLYTYLEAYGVVANALLTLDNDTYEDEKSLVEACVFVGEEMHWMGKIHRVESVSKPFLQNGIRLAKNKGLIPSIKKPKKREIKAFIKSLNEHSERIVKLQSFVTITKSSPAKVIPLDRKVVPGTKSEVVATDVIQSEGGAEIGAFFDLDRTIIKGFSAKNFFQARLMSGKMKPRELAAQFSGLLVYAIGNKNFAGLAATSTQGVKGVPEKVFIELGEEVYLKHLADAIYPESRALVSAHMAKGHTVAIISAATPYQVDPVARDLGIEHVMCTKMEVLNGKFTGKIIEPPCWGEGKYKAAKELAERYNLDLSKSYFYTDSHEDLPLMEMVGEPRAINPDNELAALAMENDWPILRFSDEIQPGVSNMIRTALTMGSFIPAAMTGIASTLLTGSRQDGVNSMISTIGELGTKMAGIKMVVKGEDNLWTHRPAVIIFNHQSNADFFIVAKLLKKDTVAVAKKELKSSPIGPLLQAAGVVFLDRTNREKAIEALKPAVDTLKSGISVAIAPEGTRSYDYNLGPFKKGAFHLAMQAGVPIVPIVVKNAHDVMPRGRNLVRPSVVEVVVLKPIPIEGWSKENLDQKISEVRSLYIKELHQEEFKEIT